MTATGTTRKVYGLGPVRHLRKRFPIGHTLDESLLWEREIEPFVQPLPSNVVNILHYGFTEIVNNARDHSGGGMLEVDLFTDKKDVDLRIADDGEGIFRRVARLCGLADERQAVLEIAKGRLTTAPKEHTGEGIFFTSRAFDSFAIHSGGLSYRRGWEFAGPDEPPEAGTLVCMSLRKDSPRQLREVFDEYAPPEEFAFSKTVVPLALARREGENLLSRSQAKRVLARCEQFGEVDFDFTGVPEIGQGFADEIFRVFANRHPRTKLVPVNFNDAVGRMLRHVGAIPRIQEDAGTTRPR